MSSIKEIIDSIPESSTSESDMDVMMNPDYLKESSKIISDALHKGFDVLQLENGDIVTTGTKVIVTQYHWDSKKSKMSKLTTRERKKRAKGEKASSSKKSKPKKK